MHGVLKSLLMATLAVAALGGITRLAAKDPFHVILEDFTSALLASKDVEMISSLPHAAHDLDEFWNPDALALQRRLYREHLGDLKDLRDVKGGPEAKIHADLQREYSATVACDHGTVHATYVLRRSRMKSAPWTVYQYAFTSIEESNETLLSDKSEQHRTLEQGGIDQVVERVAQGDFEKLNRIMSGEAVRSHQLPSPYDPTDEAIGKFESVMRTSFRDVDRNTIEAKFLATHEHVRREITVHIKWTEFRYMISSWAEKELPR